MYVTLTIRRYTHPGVRKGLRGLYSLRMIRGMDPDMHSGVRKSLRSRTWIHNSKLMQIQDLKLNMDPEL